MRIEEALLGRVGHRVTMSVRVSMCAIGCSFFLGLSLDLRPHDQIPASHWSTLLPYHIVVGVVVVVVVVVVVKMDLVGLEPEVVKSPSLHSATTPKVLN